MKKVRLFIVIGFILCLSMFLVACGDNKEKYTVYWYNYDDTLITTTQIQLGKEIVYNGQTPTREATQAYTYEFTGWETLESDIVGTYKRKAIFEQKDRYYNVIWQDYDGTTLATESVKYNDYTYYKGTYPTRPATENSVFVIDKWTGGDFTFNGVCFISQITQNTTFTLTYKEVSRYHTLTWKWGEEILKEEQVEYGTQPQWTGELPTRKTDNCLYQICDWSTANDLTNGITNNTIMQAEYSYMKFEENTLIEFGYTFTQKPLHLDIPSTFNGYTITTIARQIFANDPSLITEITIPKTITTIDSKAFFEKTLILSSYNDHEEETEEQREIVLYFNATNLQDFAFESESLSPFINFKITKVVVGEKVEIIPDYMFCGVSTLENVVFLGNKDNIKIGQHSFDGTKYQNNM